MSANKEMIVTAKISKKTDDMLDELKLESKKNGEKKYKKELMETAVTEYYNKIFKK